MSLLFLSQPVRSRNASVFGERDDTNMLHVGLDTPDMASNPLESQSLLEQVAAGTSGAVALCIDRFGGLVWSLARKSCRNLADAEDAVQEIFTEIWRYANRYDPSVASEATFISTIARRRLIDRQRKVGRSPKLEAFSPTTDAIEAQRIDVAELEDEIQRAKQALDNLSEDQQAALRLSIYEGHSHGEIAKRMDVPLGTVKTNIRRGLMRLREMLSDQNQEGGQS